MNWSIDLSKVPTYVRVRIDGEFTPAENRALWDKILSSKRWRPGTSVLVDGLGLEPLGEYGQLYALEAARYFAEKEKEIGRCFIAVCNISHDFYRYAREFQHGLLTNDLKVVIQNFATEQSAIDWLTHLAEINRERNGSIRRKTANAA